jgi:hypothetical protein
MMCPIFLFLILLSLLYFDVIIVPVTSLCKLKFSIDFGTGHVAGLDLLYK